VDVPTNKPLLEKIKAGQVRVGTIPCHADHLPSPGERMTFREATFGIGVPNPVPNGDSVSVTLTSVVDTHTPYLGYTLCTLRWDSEESVEK
jgi:hypothetical protein